MEREICNQKIGWQSVAFVVVKVVSGCKNGLNLCSSSSSSSSSSLSRSSRSSRSASMTQLELVKLFIELGFRRDLTSDNIQLLKVFPLENRMDALRSCPVSSDGAATLRVLSCSSLVSWLTELSHRSRPPKGPLRWHAASRTICVPSGHRTTAMCQVLTISMHSRHVPYQSARRRHPASVVLGRTARRCCSFLPHPQPCRPHRRPRHQTTE